MADTSNRGLGSDNMDPQTKHDIQSEGGKASHSGGRKGGQSSQDQGSTGQSYEDAGMESELTE